MSKEHWWWDAGETWYPACGVDLSRGLGGFHGAKATNPNHDVKEVTCKRCRASLRRSCREMDEWIRQRKLLLGETL